MSNRFRLSALTDLRLDKLPPGVVAKQARGFRVPVVLLQWPGDFSDRRRLGDALDMPLCDFLESFPQTRCVHLARLPAILKNGVDVEPTSSIIYVDHPGKALEYGRDNGAGVGACDQVMMVFHRDRLAPAACQIRKTASAAELAAVRRTYPTQIDLDENWFAFSIASPEDMKQVGVYVLQYGASIPGDAWEALAMLVLVGDDINRLKRALSACRDGEPARQSARTKLPGRRSKLR